jgi:hypothetical protein
VTERDVKLGFAIGYSGAQMRVPIGRIQLAERLGHDSVWTAEAYGSDAITPLAFITGRTTRIRLGTGVIQLAGRTPANAALHSRRPPGSLTSCWVRECVALYWPRWPHNPQSAIPGWIVH